MAALATLVALVALAVPRDQMMWLVRIAGAIVLTQKDDQHVVMVASKVLFLEPRVARLWTAI